MRWLVGLIVVMWCGVASAAPEIHICTQAITGIDAKERAQHVDALRRSMTDAIRDAGIDAKTVDLAVTKLAVVIGDDKVEITAEIKLVISTTDDQIRTFGSGSATFSISRRQFRSEQAAALRHQVLNDALEALQRRMRATYRRVA